MSNPAVSTSNGYAAVQVQQVVANNVIAGTIGPVQQVNQKKVPVFHGETGKDSMTVLARCQCMDVTRTSWGDVKDSRSYIDTLFSIRPQTSDSMKKHQPQKSNSGGNNSNRNKGEGKNFQSGNASAGTSAPWKKYKYCGKYGHGMEECFFWKADEGLCYTTKGEPFYPKGESKGGPSGSTTSSSFKTAAPLSTAKPQDFPHWVLVSPLLRPLESFVTL